MTTQIVPASGQGALFTQQGPGTSPGYSALDDRRSNSGSLQEGVYGTSSLVSAGGVSNVAAADFMVTQRAAGANLSVDVNMPPGGFAFVQGDTLSGQGLYCVPVHSANINEVIAAADPSNPRIDQVILEVQDNVLDASGGNLARTRVLTGTPTAGATVTNRFGAAALPGSALLLADVLVSANATTIPNTTIHDRRKWARGAFVSIRGTSGTQSTASLSLVAVSGMGVRIETSGAPLKLTLNATGFNATSGDGVATGYFVDGAGDGTGALGEMISSVANGPQKCGFSIVSTFTPGSHGFFPTFEALSGGTANLLASTTSPLVFILEEIVRLNTQNNTVTSG